MRYTRRIVLAVTTLLLAAILILIANNGLNAEQSNGSSFNVLSRKAEGFTQARPDYPLSFPRDYGVHPEFATEWWYLTANVKDEHGREYGIQWTLFRNAMTPEKSTGWQDSNIYMAHIAVTTDDNQWHAERFARGGIGQAGVLSHPFTAWLDNWRWKALGEQPFPSLLTANDEDFGFRLTLQQTVGQVAHGINGFSQRHSTQNSASHYFSAPQLTVRGLLFLGELRIPVEGRGWFDKEWSSGAMAADQEGWDWFSLNLDDGRSLMVTQIRGEEAPFRFGTLVDENGNSIPLASEDFLMEPVSLEKMEQGMSVPVVWHIQVPEHGIDISTSPLNNQSWLPLTFPYWEGPVHAKGTVTGQGFMEATGYR